MNKYFYGLIVLIALISFGYYLRIGAKISYKLSGRRGYSSTIVESKERGVFIYELKWNIEPDSIKITSGKRFYIEKAFRYGEESAKKTVIIQENGESLYQLAFEPRGGVRLNNDSLTFGIKDFSKLNDMYSADIVYRLLTKKNIVGKITFTPR